MVCDNDACCGPYDAYQVRVGWDSGTDNVAGSDLRYNVYRREGASLVRVAAEVSGTELYGSHHRRSAWVPLEALIT